MVATAETKHFLHEAVGGPTWTAVYCQGDVHTNYLPPGTGMLPLMLTLLYRHWNLCDGGFQWLRKGDGATAAGAAMAA